MGGPGGPKALGGGAVAMVLLGGGLFLANNALFNGSWPTDWNGTELC